MNWLKFKIQNPISHVEFNSVKDLINIFRAPSRKTLENQKKLYSSFYL